MRKNIRSIRRIMLSVSMTGILAAGLTGCGMAAGTAAAVNESETITVTSSSSVYMVPDKATVSFGVTTQEKTAEQAQNKNSETVDKVIEALTGRGVEEKSIRTVNFSMYPMYDYSDDGDEKISGYVVYTTMNIQDQDVDSVGNLIAACVSAGINNIDSVSFFCSSYDEAYEQALAQAVESSREKAESLAAVAGKSLGEIITITEGWQDSSARYDRSAGASFSMAEASSIAAPSIQPGESEISAVVTVTYKIN